MRRKQVLALLALCTMFSAVSLSTLRVEAAGLTQAASAEEVQYGSLTEDEINLIKGLFDYEYYKEQNPELAELIGDDYDTLFEHFYLCGIFEGRTCNPNFDPAAYASAYEDLRESFGSNIIKYYQHYIAFGGTDDRTITTIEACAVAGIPVTSLVENNVVITPEAYKIAREIGTNDFAVVQKTLNQIASNTSSSSSSSGESSGGAVVVADKEIDPVYAEAHGLTLVGTVEVDSASKEGTTIATGQYYLYVAKGTTGYGLYESERRLSYDYSAQQYNSNSEINLVYNTENYSEADNIYANIVADIEIYFDDTNYTDFAIGGTYNSNGEYAYQYLQIDRAGDVPDSGIEIQSYVDELKNGTRARSDDLDVEATQENTYSTTQTFVNEYDMENHQMIQVSDSEREYYSNFLDGTYEKTVGVDAEGTIGTVYEVGASIEEGEDATTVTVGLSNEENNFGYVLTFDLPADEN